MATCPLGEGAARMNRIPMGLGGLLLCMDTWILGNYFPAPLYIISGWIHNRILFNVSLGINKSTSSIVTHHIQSVLFLQWKIPHSEKEKEMSSQQKNPPVEFLWCFGLVPENSCLLSTEKAPSSITDCNSGERWRGEDKFSPDCMDVPWTGSHCDAGPVAEAPADPLSGRLVVVLLSAYFRTTALCQPLLFILPQCHCTFKETW